MERSRRIQHRSLLRSKSFHCHLLESSSQWTRGRGILVSRRHFSPFEFFSVYKSTLIRPFSLERCTLTNSYDHRVIVFYPTSAIMTLFLNIIMYPLDPQAKLDIDLLSAAAELVRNMPVRKMTSHEIGHMKLVNDFVAELIRLANCAIAKATIEREQGQQDSTTA